jgi:hypothetical protein
VRKSVSLFEEYSISSQGISDIKSLWQREKVFSSMLKKQEINREANWG